LLREPYSPTQIEQKLPAFVADFYADQFDKPASQVLTLHLQPLTDIHLHSKLEKEIYPNSDIAYVYIFSIIAFFILLIACINFINLATAQFTKRLREVGIRKVVGAQRPQLAKQFLSETLVMTFFAVLIAFLLIELCTPSCKISPANPSLSRARSQTAGVGHRRHRFVCRTRLRQLPCILHFQIPADSGIARTGARSAHTALLRKGLVVFQFVISIFLIIGAMIIHHQLKYFTTHSWDLTKNQWLRSCSEVKAVKRCCARSKCSSMLCCSIRRFYP
jgi:putative ABC transport system permease protein